MRGDYDGVTRRLDVMCGGTARLFSRSMAQKFEIFGCSATSMDWSAVSRTRLESPLDGSYDPRFSGNQPMSAFGLTDKPPAPEFVAYWTNNGQKAALGLDLSAAIDPKRTLADQ
jgi:hypothetical protein